MNHLGYRTDGSARLDVDIAEHVPELSRSAAQRLINDGKVLVNGRPEKASYRPTPGDKIDVELEAPPSLSARPEAIPLDVVYQDTDLAVIDKPAGMVVHPAAGHPGGTLANALVALFPSAGSAGPTVRPGIVHRLDKDTSGLIVVALSATAQQSLQRQIAHRTAKRSYLALVTGRPEPDSGVIDAPIGRDPKDRKRMATYGVAARDARTAFRVVETLPGVTLVEATLQTGRTHQIRVHFAAIGHPVVGDQVYGGESIFGLRRQFLHACYLALRSPTTGKDLEFRSRLPDDLASVLDRLRRGRKFVDEFS
jgi:23S rRNA pseudouridine1911/1915/1917 synthase